MWGKSPTLWMAYPIRRLSSSLVGNVAYLSVVISSVCLWWFFGEEINLAVGAGLALILTGAVLSSR